jgi:hypothetical protein
LFHKRNRTRDPRVPEPKRSPWAIFNAACPFSSEFLVKVTFVSTRPGILRSRRILNHTKPSITAGGIRHEKFCVSQLQYSSIDSYSKPYSCSQTCSFWPCDTIINYCVPHMCVLFFGTLPLYEQQFKGRVYLMKISEFV